MAFSTKSIIGSFLGLCLLIAFFLMMTFRSPLPIIIDNTGVIKPRLCLKSSFLKVDFQK